MTLITRETWGAAAPHGSFTPVRHGGQGTVHYTASPITRSGRRNLPKPEKPGAKWYALWRNPLTPAIQRRRISRTIAAYNREARKLALRDQVPAWVAGAERAIMRQIQAFHQGPSRGWTDLAYHRVLFASGNVYEGRPLGVRGAHAFGANDTVGYAFVMGVGDEPTEFMLDSFREQTKNDGITAFKGHRQRPGNSTSCPGDPLMAALNL